MLKHSVTAHTHSFDYGDQGTYTTLSGTRNTAVHTKLCSYLAPAAVCHIVVTSCYYHGNTNGNDVTHETTHAVAAVAPSVRVDSEKLGASSPSRKQVSHNDSEEVRHDVPLVNLIHNNMRHL